MRRQPALSPDKLRFLPPVNYWKKAKRMDDKKKFKKKKRKRNSFNHALHVLFGEALYLPGKHYPS